MRPCHLLPSIVLLTACGAAPVARRVDPTELSTQLAEAELALPPAPPGTMVGDGFGPTLAEAVQDARRAVSEQITARVESEVEGTQSEINGEASAEARLRVRTTSSFEHAELMRTIGAAERPGGFVARVVLDRDDAAKVYRAELEADRERLATLEPTVREAIATLDTAVLLSTAHAPGEVLASMRRKGRVIEALGRDADATGPAEAMVLEREASAVRARAEIRLRVDSEVSEPLRRAAAGEIGRQLQARGCRFIEEGRGAGGAELPPDAPVALATLRLRQRDHEERGLKWRYLGLELSVVDARSGRQVMRFVGMPDLVHGGGPDWPRADEATARALRGKLAEKGAHAFAAITCR